jgi:aminopeptidase-like protein
LNLSELQNNLYSLPDQPTAIPYVTSYYQERWGFCLTQQQRNSLEDGEYEVFIDSELFEGFLTYGELLIKGETDKEIFISTYICHPSMANNELSGPTVATFLAIWLSGRPKNRYSYRFVFIPETIGSIAYLSANKDNLRANVYAGFNVTCIGDNRDYSFLPSRNGKTISDEVAKHVLKHICPTYKSYKWTDRGSDERQYCSPGIDLPIASIMRTKYGKYDEYHTSLDDLVSVVTPEGLDGGFNALKIAIEVLEENKYPKINVYGEPQLGKRGLYPTLSTKTSSIELRLMMDLITWSDGSKSMLEIAEICDVPIWTLYPIVRKLNQHGLLSLLDEPVKFSI